MGQTYNDKDTWVIQTKEGKIIETCRIKGFAIIRLRELKSETSNDLEIVRNPKKEAWKIPDKYHKHQKIVTT